MSLADNLVAYYSLENVNDALGSNNLTNNATVTFTAGKVSNAGTFASASSQYLSHADTATLDMGDIDFTITCWVKLTSKPANTMNIVAKNNATGNQRGYQVQWVNTTDRFRLALSSDGTSTNQVLVSANNFGAPSTATYYFLAARYNAATDTMSLSVNNGTPDTGTLAGGAFANTAEFQIGAAAATNFWNGQIDEVGVWKRLLSDAEITDLYNSGSGRDYAYVGALSASDSESTAIADAPTVNLGVSLSVSDSATVADTPTVTRSGGGVVDDTVSISDSATVADTPALTLTIRASASDSAATNDTPAVAAILGGVSASDSTTVNEAVALLRTPLLLTVSESVTLDDTPFVYVGPAALTMAMLQAVTVVDEPTIELGALPITHELAVSDSITTGEFVAGIIYILATPADRITSVAAENRIGVIAFENRTIVVQEAS